MPEIMVMHEVCDVLRISLQTAYRLCWAGELPSVKVGRQRRVRREDLLAYLDRQGKAVAC